MARLNLLIIFFIFSIAAFVRFWHLAEYPVHLSIDEAAIGVAAGQIAATGRDEYSVLMPLAFESTGDYKPPVTVYLVSVFIKILGLREFSVRLPVAILGALTPALLFLILRKLKFNKFTGLLTGIWMAVSVWHVHYSRATFGAVTALFFLFLGFWLFLTWLQKKSQMLALLSSASFALSVWSYHSHRVFVPLFVVAIVYIFREDLALTRLRRQLINFFLLALALALPFFYLTFLTPAVKERAASTSIFRETSLVNSLHEKGYSSLGEFAFDNNLFLIARHWVGKYINYFDLRYWFVDGLYFTPPGYQDLGLLYLVDIPVFIAGVFALIKSENKKIKGLAGFWFLAGPLAASFAMNEQHPLRSLVWIGFFILILAQGFDFLAEKFGKAKIAAIYVSVLILNLVYAKNIYTKAFPYYFSEAWQYGYEEISQFACENKAQYDKIFVSESFGTEDQYTSVPHYYLAFYCGGRPVDYISGNPLIARPGIYLKRPLWEVDRVNYPNSLFIAAPFDFPKDLEEERVIKKIYYPNGKDAFWFVETD